MPETILIIEDAATPGIGAQIRTILHKESRYRVVSREELPSHTEKSANPIPDLIVLILPLATTMAEQLLAEVAVQTAVTPLLIVVGVDMVVRKPDLLPSNSAFLVMPLRKVEVLARIKRLLAHRRERERVRVKQSVTEAAGLSQLVGEAPSFAAVKLKIHQLAQSELPVLITRETGTGKELCARALHYLSRPAAKPFLPVNCGSIQGWCLTSRERRPVHMMGRDHRLSEQAEEWPASAAGPYAAIGEGPAGAAASLRRRLVIADAVAGPAKVKAELEANGRFDKLHTLFSLYPLDFALVSLRRRRRPLSLAGLRTVLRE